MLAVEPLTSTGNKFGLSGRVGNAHVPGNDFLLLDLILNNEYDMANCVCLDLLFLPFYFLLMYIVIPDEQQYCGS